jgi:tryptophan synthase alpha chain
MLKSYIDKKLRTKKILLMTHIVLGYPSFKDSMDIVEQMVEAGVDLMELQIPFSEPMADGPVIVRANQKSIENGSSVEKCFEFAKNAAKKFDIPFLFMSYANILYKFGMENFSDQMTAMDLKGAIVPDIPPEEANEYINAMKKNQLSPIFIYSPETSDKRMKYIAKNASGFIYCVARKGVTGKETQFSNELEIYLKRCRKSTILPLAVGFGVKNKTDINYLKGKADIAVIGSETIRIVDKKGIKATFDFIKSLSS